MNRSVDMYYDPIQERWLVELGGRDYGLHCGECFELIIGTLSIPCRLERDSDWYIIMKDARMSLRKQETYKINV